MPRPKHPRTIHSPPSVGGFKPRSGGRKKEVTLSVEEFEAIRLVDFEGLDQIRASALMGVSRQTFGRVLKSGRFTLSKALVKGLPLTVGGGCYEIRGGGNTGGRQRHRRGVGANVMEQQINSGGNIMVENNEQENKGTPSPGNSPGQGRGQGCGQGQGRGRGLGGGKGDGSCRRKDGGRGRGMGGGKGNGSCGAR